MTGPVLPRHLFQDEANQLANDLASCHTAELEVIAELGGPEDYRERLRQTAISGTKLELANIEVAIEEKRRQPLSPDHKHFAAFFQMHRTTPESTRRAMFGDAAIDAEQAEERARDRDSLVTERDQLKRENESLHRQLAQAREAIDARLMADRQEADQRKRAQHQHRDAQ